MTIILYQSVGHAFAPNYPQNSLNDNFDVQQKGLIHKIIMIKLHLNGNRQLIPAVYLRPSRKAWSQPVNPFLSSQLNQIILVEESRPGANNHPPYPEASNGYYFSVTTGKE